MCRIGSIPIHWVVIVRNVSLQIRISNHGLHCWNIKFLVEDVLTTLMQAFVGIFNHVQWVFLVITQEFHHLLHRCHLLYFICSSVKPNTFKCVYQFLTTLLVVNWLTKDGFLYVNIELAQMVMIGYVIPQLSQVFKKSVVESDKPHLFLYQLLTPQFLTSNKCREPISPVEQLPTAWINKLSVDEQHPQFILFMQKVHVALTQQTEWLTALALLLDAEVHPLPMAFWAVCSHPHQNIQQLLLTATTYKEIEHKNIMQDTPINKRFILNGRGTHFPLAVASSYEEIFPQQLQGIMPKSGFQLHIDQINDVARRYWPCCTAYVLGIGCCPFTFGLSCLLPRICLSDAEGMIRRRISEANQQFFYTYGWEMELHVGWCSSYLLLQEKGQQILAQDQIVSSPSHMI